MVERSEVQVEEGLESNSKTPSATDERPQWLQDKFESPEELAKAYNELEKKLGQRSTPDEGWKTEPKEGEEATEESEATEEVAEEAPVQTTLPGIENELVEEISKHAWENRSLSDEHYETLEKAGYSRDVVDQFMAGQFAQQDAAQSALLNAGGGQENVNSMFSWAEENLTQDQIDVYNGKFDQGGPDAIMAMEHLKARYDASGEAAAKTVSGAVAPSVETSVYRSAAQVVEAISDPRYKSDPAYRAEVERKIARSNVM